MHIQGDSDKGFVICDNVNTEMTSTTISDLVNYLII